MSRHATRGSGRRGRLVDALDAVRAERALLEWWCYDHDLANGDCPIWQEIHPAGIDELVIFRDDRLLAWVALEQRRGPAGWHLSPARRMVSASESGQHWFSPYCDDIMQARNAMAVCSPTFVAPPVARAALAAEAAMTIIAARLAADSALGLAPYADGPWIPGPGENDTIPGCCDGGCEDPLTWNPRRWCGPRAAAHTAA